MQEDDSQSEQEEQPLSENGRAESQPEPEQQSTSKQADDSESEPEEQPLSGKERDESHPEPEQQPTTEGAADQGQPRLQARPAPPIPLPLTERQKRRQYFLGLAFGLIPLIVLLITIGAGSGPGENGLGILLFGALLAVILYIIELIPVIVFLANKQRRFVGYGLLTAFLAIPVVVAIGCYVILNPPHL